MAAGREKRSKGSRIAAAEIPGISVLHQKKLSGWEYLAGSRIKAPELVFVVGDLVVQCGDE